MPVTYVPKGPGFMDAFAQSFQQGMDRGTELMMQERELKLKQQQLKLAEQESQQNMMMRKQQMIMQREEADRQETAFKLEQDRALADDRFAREAMAQIFDSYDIEPELRESFWSSMPEGTLMTSAQADMLGSHFQRDRALEIDEMNRRSLLANNEAEARQKALETARGELLGMVQAAAGEDQSIAGLNAATERLFGPGISVGNINDYILANGTYNEQERYFSLPEFSRTGVLEDYLATRTDLEPEQQDLAISVLSRLMGDDTSVGAFDVNAANVIGTLRREGGMEANDVAVLFEAMSKSGLLGNTYRNMSLPQIQNIVQDRFDVLDNAERMLGSRTSPILSFLNRPDPITGTAANIAEKLNIRDTYGNIQNNNPPLYNPSTVTQAPGLSWSKVRGDISRRR